LNNLYQIVLRDDSSIFLPLYEKNNKHTFLIEDDHVVVANSDQVEMYTGKQPSDGKTVIEGVVKWNDIRLSGKSYVRRNVMKTQTIEFNDIAAAAGFTPGADGRINLPNTQETADTLALAVLQVVGTWMPGDESLEVTLTGAAPVWAYLKIAHSLHGRAARLVYAAPTATIEIYNHGA
jgi:hypothetical protein